MKKAILTFGLFSMVMVLTSFTTPDSKIGEIKRFGALPIIQNSVVLPNSFEVKNDNEPGGTLSPTRPTKKLDFEPGTVSPTQPTKKLD